MGRAYRDCLRSSALGLLGALLLGGLGCSSAQTRGQVEDEPEPQLKYDEVKTIGDVTDAVENAEPVPVFGVGLVTNLENTGGGAPPGDYLTMLKVDLEKQGIRKVDEVLNDPHNALVLVTAQVPAGAHRGDPIDAEVALPPQSRATSLRGGRLLECSLFDYATMHGQNPDGGFDVTKKGHTLVRAKGPVLVGIGDGDEVNRVKSGRIWSGGLVRCNRTFLLVLKGKSKDSSRIAANVAQRLNDTFRGSLAGTADSKIATVSNPSVIEIAVPLQYRHNLPRYLRVVRLVVYGGEGKEPAASVAAYRHRLEEDLLDPARCLTTALRLEALGTDSIPVLKRGLDSPHVLVRFCAAEALAYLGSPSGADELAKEIETQWALRAFGLTALASLDEAASRTHLRELMTSEAPEIRYGAFRALRALYEDDDTVQGEPMHGGYWLHRVAPQTTGLVHMSTSQRAEIVLFGEEAYLKSGFSFLAGDFAVTSAQVDQRCTISHVSLDQGRTVTQCSLKLEDVLRTMDRMGAQYPEVVEFLRQADTCKSVSCPVRHDAMPQATSVFELARAGRDTKRRARMAAAGITPSETQDDEEILNAQAEMLSTPTLFDQSTGRRSSALSPSTEGKADGPPRSGRARGEHQAAGRSTDGAGE